MLKVVPPSILSDAPALRLRVPTLAFAALVTVTGNPIVAVSLAPGTVPVFQSAAVAQRPLMFDFQEIEVMMRVLYLRRYD